MLDLEQYRARLEEEKAKLEGELSHLGEPNPKVNADWEPTSADFNAASGEIEKGPVADDLDAANRLEEYRERALAEEPLEARYHEVVAALDRMRAGTYGVCDAGGDHQIEEERLSANPAAMTCMAHM